MKNSEPVRLYLYGLLVPLAAVLVFYGVLDGNAVPLLLALATAVLGVPAVEVARHTVSSPDTVAELAQGSADGLRAAGYTVIAPPEEG